MVIEDYKKSNDFLLNNIRYVKQSLKLVISMLYGFSLYLLGASLYLWQAQNMREVPLFFVIVTYYFIKI